MKQWLFSFGFTWPEELEYCAKHPDADLGESSELVFVVADSEERALSRGEELAEAFVHALYGERAYSWRELRFARWIEDDPKIVEWARNHSVPVAEADGDTQSVVKEMIGGQ